VVGASAATAEHQGLTSAEAKARLAEFGPNLLVTTTRGARVMAVAAHALRSDGVDADRGGAVVPR